MNDTGRDTDGRTGRLAAGRFGRARRRDAHRGGQVLIITLIAMTLLVGLLFYVYNVGDQVNRRLEMQSAADAVAVTGAGWMARSMNVVAMDNVGMAKMLSLVPILDTQPLAAKMAYEEVKAWEQALAGLVAQPRIDPHVSAQTENYLRQGIESLRGRMALQRDILRPFAEAINPPNFDMETITHWAKQGVQGAPPHGALWRAAMTMEEFSRAAVDTCGVLAQQRAARMGLRNGATAAFLVPVLPQMPARLGEYMDFQPTIRGRCRVVSEGAEMWPTGGAGGAIPDMTYPYRLGPWARLHRWRDYIREFIRTGRRFVPGRQGAGRTRGSHGHVGVAARKVGRSARQRSDRGRPDRWVATGYHQLLGYTTYGPYEWARRHLHWWARGTNANPGSLRDTFYYEYVDKIARIKLDYMFPANGVGEATETKEIHYPVWIVPYPQCKQIGEDPNNNVAQTMFYVVEIASKYPEESGMFMTPGTFRTNGDYPIAMWVRGWSDPAKWNLPMVSNYVWKDAYVYETTQDSELGITRQTIPPGDPNGEVVWQPVYMYAWYIFGGIDIGGSVEISNPCNWDEYDRLPAPYLLDTSTGDYGGDDPDVGWRRDRFMFLGVVRKRMDAPVWPQRFSHVNPVKGTITVAQAKLFNNKSFGLWTQDWQVQLAPVTRIVPAGDPLSWAAKLRQGVSQAGGINGVDGREVETAYEYLSSLDEDMARLYMNH
ncbi:MAG: hypothetical protein J7M21_04510 [Planctomycetes bacterium]|nr:hypothetical protein [Planctomycetota bacterium]